MKLYVSPAQFVEARLNARDDEARGIDPGLRWKELWPDADEIELVVDATLETEQPNA